MKKRILLSCITLCSVVLCAMAQRGYNFNAVALNVDGLPEKVSFVTINSGGPLAEGTKTLSSLIAQKDWGFVGLSEDFNFHTELMSSISHLYNSGTHRGKVTGTSNNTDGLGLLCAKWYSFSNESWTQWNKSDGDLLGNLTEDNGADELIAKGYRYYKVTIAAGFDIDVYVLHMDAASRQADIDARESQLKQLAAAVKTNTSNNKRPVIILGDTNCRYTREKLKELLIDEINKDARFTIKDAWIEKIWNGVYPTYGGEAMMTHTYGAQRGEVVDKVFYINTTESNLTLKANSYLNDESINVSDHSPIVVNFTLTDPNGTPEDVELEGPAGEVVLTDGAPTAPTTDLSGTYYLKNVASGLYLKAARGYGAQASEGVHAIPTTFNKVNNTTYYITSTIPERDGQPTYLGSDLYFDNHGHADFTLQEIVRSDGAKKYMLVLNNQAVASEANGEGVGFAAYNVADTKQHWMLYTDDMIKEELKETVSGTTYNASTLIPYGRVDTHHADTRKPLWQGGPAFSGWSNHANHCMERWFAGNSDQRFDVYQDITGLPEGTYTLTAQAFHRDGGHGTSSKNVIPDLYATNGSSKTFTTKICSINDASAPSTKPNNMHEAGDAFLGGAYNVTLGNVTVGSDGKLRIGVRNTSTAANSNDLWCIFNNFQLLYHGTAQGDLKGTELYKGIKAAVEEAQALIATQSAEVQAAFDISAVIYRYNNYLLSADGAWERAAIDNAVRTAVKSQTAVGADLSLAIVNPSFETGDLTGWTVLQNGWDTGANSGQNAQGMDGRFLFNTWAGETYGCGVIYQDVTGLRNGHYVLQAMVTSWADRKAYIVANDQHVGVATTAGEGVFVDLSLDFLVEDGTARIGAVGGNENGDFYYKQGIFYKADHFRLTYKGSVGDGRVKIALAKAKAEADKLGEVAKAQFNADVAQYENASVSGDGKVEEAAIYAALKVAIATETTAGTDMTWLITNPGFETGDWTGWTTVIGWDTRVAYATDGVAPANGEGFYIVNTWNDDVNATNSGVNAPVYQTLTGLPNGRYRLTADVASDGGNQVCVYATAGNQTVNGAASPENNWTFVEATVEFEVTNGTATIGAVGLRQGEFNIEGGCWYKVDNFRLTYVAPIAVEQVTLNETEVTLTAVGATTQLKATVNPNYATDSNVTWSTSDDKVATVNAEGVVTAVANGTATITATAGGKTATCQVTIAVAVTEVKLDKSEATLTAKDATLELNVTVLPEDAADKTVTWTSSNEAVATVDANGVVTAVANGTATITAKAGEFSASCEVTVAIAVTEVKLDKSEATLTAKDVTLALNVTVLPEDALDKTVTWTSSNTEVATVDENGVVTAVANGKATITAKAGEFSATCEVTVAIAVTEVKLDKSEATLTAKDVTLALNVTVLPEDALDKTVTWTSSNTEVATVDENGVVTAVANGTATITAEAGDFSATCEVTVAIAVTEVKLDKSEATLTAKDATLALNVTVLPEDALNKTVTWTSSNEAVATVDANGVVTAVANGTATITAKAGDFSATCEVTVAIAVTEVKLDKSEATLTAKDATLALNVTVLPEDALDKTVTWTSSNTEVATVDENGVVTAVANGKATITAKAGDFSATCEVTVAIAVTEVKLDKSEATLTAKDVTLALNVTVLPEDALDKTVTWTSSNTEVATVDENGVVTAVANGTATITAEAGDFSATCEVTVAIAVTEVKLDKSEATLTAKDVTLELNVTVLPEDALDKTVTWTSSNTEVATVDANGVVTAVAEGTATITAKAGEFSATCEVTVEYASYDFVLLINGEEYFKQSVKCGTDLATIMTTVAEPTKEGHTFSGWIEMPEIMPTTNITITGSFTVNKYTVTFKIGKDVIYSEELEYGATIVAPEVEEKEGHSFAWDKEVAKTVPAEAVTYEGAYTVNKYKVYYIIDGEVVVEHEVEYGAAIEIPEELEAMYPGFEWIGEDPEVVYETMPAFDIAFNGNDVTGLDRLSIDSNAVIYDLSGRRVLEAVKGFYIINGKKVFIK